MSVEGTSQERQGTAVKNEGMKVRPHRDNLGMASGARG